MNQASQATPGDTVLFHYTGSLKDGTVFEVRHIGLRVTELYNVNSHSIIYVPNSQLAN